LSKNSNSRELKTQDFYDLVSATLQEHFQLDMTNRKYTVQDIWDVLIAASVERISIEMASKLLETAPSGTIVRPFARNRRWHNAILKLAVEIWPFCPLPNLRQICYTIRTFKQTTTMNGSSKQN